MNKQIDKRLLALHKLGLIRPLIQLFSKLREKVLKKVGYNIVLIPNRLIKIDLFTDSLMHFYLPQKRFLNKSHIEASYLNLEDTFKKHFGYKYVLPVAQGRMAEIIFAKIMVSNAMVIPSNMLFVTTRIHQELNGATVLEIPVKDAYDLKSGYLFKGNMDTKKLDEVILEHGADWIPYIYVETCVNASGGHPVSMQNIKEVSRIAKEHNISVILDACRILENAYLIKEKEEGYANKSVSEIVKEFCSYTDGCTMSASKDFFVESGGFIATNSEETYYNVQDALLVFGGGLSLREKAVLNSVLNKTFADEKLVAARVKKAGYLYDKLKKYGLPVVNPAGGFGVFLDISELDKVLPAESYPEKSFLAQLYLSSGIRVGENILTPYQKKQKIKMLRLIIPARMYSLRDMDYVAKSLKIAWENRHALKGLKKTYQPPSLSGSFFAEYDLI